MLVSEEEANAAIEATLARAGRVFTSVGSLPGLLSEADKELSERLHGIVKKAGGPDARFSEANALLCRRQIRLVQKYMSKRFAGLTHEEALKAIKVSVKSTVKLAARLEERFTGVAKPLALEAQAMQDAVTRGAGASLLQQHQSSVDRYGAAMIGDFERQLRLGVLQGLSNHHVISRLVSAGELGGVNSASLHESEPAFFPRPTGYLKNRYWAERIVRTEKAYAYNAAGLSSINTMRMTDFPDMQKKILAHFDTRTAADSVGVHGQVRPVHGLFRDGAGREYLHPPARPNDRETVVPWRPHWTDLESTASADPVEQAAVPVEQAPEKPPAVLKPSVPKAKLEAAAKKAELKAKAQELKAKAKAQAAAEKAAAEKAKKLELAKAAEAKVQAAAKKKAAEEAAQAKLQAAERRKERRQKAAEKAALKGKSAALVAAEKAWKAAKGARAELVRVVRELPERKLVPHKEPQLWDGSPLGHSLIEQSRDFDKKLTGREREAIESFTGSGFYSVRESEVSGRPNNLSRLLQAALKKGKAPDIAVYRGVKGLPLAELNQWLGGKKFGLGERGTGGTASTSHSSAVSEEFAGIYRDSFGKLSANANGDLEGDRLKVLLRLRNKHGVPIDTISLYMSEREVLQPKKARFRATDAYRVKGLDGVLVVEAEAVD